MSYPSAALTRDELAGWIDPPLWAMVHLSPLPGSPRFSGDPGDALRRARADAEVLVDIGFRGLVVENYGDIPFHGGAVPPVTVASLARVAAALRAEWPQLRLAINCLRNDACAAMSIAAAAEADAIRVNVHTGAALTDQGVLTGNAADTLRLRRELDAPVRILADLRVKHAAPLAPRGLEIEAWDLRERGLADAILITGEGTGSAADPSIAARLRDSMPDVPLFVASGVTPESAATWASEVDGAIVGSALMVGRRAGAGVDRQRATELLQAWQEGIKR